MADIIHRSKPYFHNIQQQRVRDKIKMYIFIRSYMTIKEKNNNNKIWQHIYLNYQHVCIGNAYWKRYISFIDRGVGLEWTFVNAVITIRPNFHPLELLNLDHSRKKSQTDAKLPPRWTTVGDFEKSSEKIFVHAKWMFSFVGLPEASHYLTSPTHPQRERVKINGISDHANNRTDFFNYRYLWR